MHDPTHTLSEAGYSCYYDSFSALDRYLKIKLPGPLYLLTNSSLIDLARLFSDLHYPGLPYQDAALEQAAGSTIFQCYDDLEPPRSQAFSVLDLLYDPEENHFLDPKGIYPDLRQKRLNVRKNASPLTRLAYAAKLVSRYSFQTSIEELGLKSLEGSTPEFQQELLISILSGPAPQKGLELLFESGFIADNWPELQLMSSVPLTKDYHPEGNGWEHVLETFKHRKDNDLTLSLAMLLHDVGKPIANGPADRPFDGHAELGVKIASRFLKRLRFPYQVIGDVAFLVRFHMMPAALEQLPLYRSEKIMSSPLFPLQLELFRADLLSSYWAPDNYYEACRIYRHYLKRRAGRAPFARR